MSKSSNRLLIERNKYAAFTKKARNNVMLNPVWWFSTVLATKDLCHSSEGEIGHISEGSNWAYFFQ
jgi:hypothetical protein